MAYISSVNKICLLWTHLLFIFMVNAVSSQHSENVYVSGMANACGDVAEQIRASSGVITSPGWPFEYPSRINCSWNIRANPGEIITIRTLKFRARTDVVWTGSPLEPTRTWMGTGPVAHLFRPHTSPLRITCGSSSTLMTARLEKASGFLT